MRTFCASPPLASIMTGSRSEVCNDRALVVLTFAKEPHMTPHRKAIAHAHRPTIRRWRDEHHAVDLLRLTEIQLQPLRLVCRTRILAVPA